MASKPEQEPSIEEILASIRQIISDDDQPRETEDIVMEPEAKFEIPVAAPVREKEAPKASFADVLELTNEIPEDEPAPEEGPKFSIPFEEPRPVKTAPPPPRPEPKAETVTQFPPHPHPSLESGESLFTNTAAEATTQAFSRLMGNVPVERDDNRNLYPDGRITLEDLARDMLRPMLRDWIDTHVPRMVERLVEKELEKLARQARDD